MAKYSNILDLFCFYGNRRTIGNQGTIFYGKEYLMLLLSYLPLGPHHLPYALGIVPIWDPLLLFFKAHLHTALPSLLKRTPTARPKTLKWHLHIPSCHIEQSPYCLLALKTLQNTDLIYQPHCPSWGSFPRPLSVRALTISAPCLLVKTFFPAGMPKSA